MERCVNCAREFQDPYGNNDDSIKSENLQVFNVHQPLSTIYKLNYLSLLLDSSTFVNENENQEIWKLCENCLGLFTNLQQFYEDFNQLRSLESKLAIEIQKLDDCIQANNSQQQNTLIVKEENRQEENVNKRKRKQDLTVSPQTYRDPNPKVILHRVENDPGVQKFLSSSSPAKIVKRTRKSPKKKSTTRKAKSTKSSVRKSKVGRVKKIKEQNDDDDDDNLDSSCDVDDPPFIPSPKSGTGGGANSWRPEDDDFTDSDEDEDEQISKAKKQKKGNNDTQKVKRQRIPTDKAVLKKLRQQHKTTLDKYRSRKTKKISPCWECDLDFPTQKDCYDHTMSVHFQPGNRVCEKCSKRCKTNHGLKTHTEQLCAKLKPGELLPTFKCEKCEQQGKIITFPLKKTLTQHLNQSHFEGEVKCTFPNCTFTTNYPNRLYKHNQIHLDTSSEAERTCAECQKVFKTMAMYKTHQKSMHTEEGIVKYKEQLKRIAERRKERIKDKPKLSDETFCSECMVDMLTHAALVLHQKAVHAGQRPSRFVCDECGTGFASKGSWKKHKEYVHSNERNFFCDQCGRSFKVKTSLQIHLKIAHDEEGRLRFNADMRLQNKRRKIRKQALAQSLASGIPQFTGAQFSDLSNSASDVVNNNTNTNNTSDYNNMLSLQQNTNFGI